LDAGMERGGLNRGEARGVSSKTKIYPVIFLL
jgi:hypothetical protein